MEPLNLRSMVLPQTTVAPPPGLRPLKQQSLARLDPQSRRSHQLQLVRHQPQKGLPGKQRQTAKWLSGALFVAVVRASSAPLRYSVFEAGERGGRQCLTRLVVDRLRS